MIIAAIKQFVAVNIARLIAVGFALVSLIGIIASIKKSGRDEERQKNFSKQLETVEKANEVEDTVRKLSAADVHKQLRDDWSRD